jgi:hypothetical protein
MPGEAALLLLLLLAAPAAAVLACPAGLPSRCAPLNVWHPEGSVVQQVSAEQSIEEWEMNASVGPAH